MADLHNSQLLVEDGQPLEIFLDGFPIRESLELNKTVKNNGGKTTKYPDDGILILSRPNYPANIEFDRFHVDWLHKTIASNTIQNLQNYKLDETDPIVEVEIINKEDRGEVESTSEGFKTGADASNPTSLDNVSDRNASSTGDHSSAEAQSQPRVIRKCASVETQTEPEPQAGSSGTSTSNKKQRYTYTKGENQRMVDYLINKKAIRQAWKVKIWKKMIEDNLIQNRKAQELAAHFRNSLRHNISEYTTHPKVLKEFEVLEKAQQEKMEFREFLRSRNSK